MKKYTFILLGVALSIEGMASSQKEKYKQNKVLTSSKKMVVIEDGVKREIRLSEESVEKSMYQRTTKVVAKKEGVVVRFKTVSKDTVGKFESKYQLKLRKKLRIGYYIFDNLSKYSDEEVVRTILKDLHNIQTVRPNWKMNNKPM